MDQINKPVLSSPIGLYLSTIYLEYTGFVVSSLLSVIRPYMRYFLGHKVGDLQILGGRSWSKRGRFFHHGLKYSVLVTRSGFCHSADQS